METKTYNIEKAGYSNGIPTALLKGLAIISVLLYNFTMSVMAQCAYPVDIIVQNEIISQGEYITYKATNSITVYNVNIDPGANVIFQAPIIIIQNPDNLSYNVTLKAENPCTGTMYPDGLTSSCKNVCIEACNGLITLNVWNNIGTPTWKWYKNALGDDSPPDLSTVIGIGASINVTVALNTTDYFVRDESGTPGPFAKIKIICRSCATTDTFSTNLDSEE